MAIRILEGDCREVLKTLADESVDCIVSSPPYWRQRDYHDLRQIGHESTPEDYIAELVHVFRECRRILKMRGTCWVNVGEKWATGGHGGGGTWGIRRAEAWQHARGAMTWRRPPPGYKDKDLVGVPWMFALAARADGWYLRQCNVWAKPNCMPESIRDRSTLAHEYVFQLTKSKTYWYDSLAARTPAMPSTQTRLAQAVERQAGSARAHAGLKRHRMKAAGNPWSANLRSVWWIATSQFRGEHYAVMPERLAEICIRAGCPRGGTVLDPFGGVGTTAIVAERLERNAILIELNRKTAQLARRHIDESLSSERSNHGE